MFSSPLSCRGRIFSIFFLFKKAFRIHQYDLQIMERSSYFLLDLLLNLLITWESKFLLVIKNKAINDDWLFLICVCWPIIWLLPEAVVKISIHLSALLPLTLAHHSDNLKIKLLTTILFIIFWDVFPNFAFTTSGTIRDYYL